MAYSPRPDATGMLLNPAVFHFASVLTHCASAAVVYVILRFLFKRPWAAAAGAVLFGVHPVQVETVAWASGLKDVLAGLFSLLALWQYLLFASAGDASYPARRFRDTRWHMGMALAAVAVGVLSKPSAIVTPLLALAVDVWCLRRPFRRAVWPALVLAAVALPGAVEARLVQTAFATPPAPLWERPLVAADALAFYLYKLVAPVHLSPDYGRRPSAALAHGWLWWTWVFPAIAGVAAWRLGKARPWLVAAGLVFVAALLPVLGLVRFTFQFYSTVADHYLYLAMLGPALAAAGWLATAKSRGAATACAAVLAALAVRSAVQTSAWRDDLALWTHATSVYPEGFAAHSNFGAAIRRTHPGDPRALDAAIGEFRKAVELNPQFIGGHDGLVVALDERGDKEGSVEHMQAEFRAMDQLGVPLSDELVQQRVGLGWFLLKNHRPRQAVDQFRTVLAARPDNAAAGKGLREATALLATQPTDSTAPLQR